MSEFNTKRVDIYAHNIKASIEFEPNTTKLANDLFEKFFSGKLIGLSDKHAQLLKDLSAPDQLDAPAGEILEMILDGLNIVVEDKPEKTEIVLTKGKKKKLKVKRGSDNFVTKYKM